MDCGTPYLIFNINENGAQSGGFRYASTSALQVNKV